MKVALIIVPILFSLYARTSERQRRRNERKKEEEQGGSKRDPRLVVKVENEKEQKAFVANEYTRGLTK